MSDLYPPPASLDGLVNEEGSFFVHVLWSGGLGEPDSNQLDSLDLGWGACLETLIRFDGFPVTRFVVCGSDWRDLWLEIPECLPARRDPEWLRELMDKDRKNHFKIFWMGGEYKGNYWIDFWNLIQGGGIPLEDEQK